MSRNRRTVEIDGRTFEEEDLWDLMVTAFEGGSNYWIGTVNMSVETRKLHSLFASEFSNTITSWRWYHQVPFVLAGTSGYKGHELEMDTPAGKYYLTITKLFEGLETMHEESPRHYKDFIEENWDAITADVFLQYALFGKVIFG
jgi:hypothetical protein